MLSRMIISIVLQLHIIFMIKCQPFWECLDHYSQPTKRTYTELPDPLCYKFDVNLTNEQ